jgi:uncharacterized membrane protein YhaH (DUF805 family)
MQKALSHFTNMYEGRLGRIDYFLASIFSICLFFVSFLPIMLMENNPVLGGGLSFFLIIYWLVYHFGIITRRGHDIGWGGGFSVFMFLLGQAIVIPHFFLLFSKDKNTNKYGEVAKGNFITRGVGK